MAPEAWNVEHNRLHHYHLGEDKDPDLVQRNLEFLRDSKVPMYQKYATVLALMPIWKWAYYAPNSTYLYVSFALTLIIGSRLTNIHSPLCAIAAYKELQIQKFKRNEIDLPKDFEPTKAATVSHILLPKDAAERATQQVIKPMDFFANVLGPFLFSRFILLPLPLLAMPGVGQSLFFHAIINLVLADLLTNLHGFITIVTNHCGDDIYTFDDQVKPKSGSFYVRQIVGSANYKTGDDVTDFAHGWLNYQIEHHVWPDLSMLQYQRGAPQLKAICEKYGVPYVQESVWTRLFKTIDVMVGNSSMKRFPTELEPASDKAGKSGVTWKSTNGAIDE
jgi:fatty acid desaturase